MEQIRSLVNSVHLAGMLMELTDLKDGTTQEGIPFIRFKGVVRCGESAVMEVPFQAFVKSKKKDGTDSKNYKTVKEWVASAVPFSEVNDATKATFVDIKGAVSDNAYINKEEKLVEATTFNCQLFSDFVDYAATIDLEGYVAKITDEIKGGEDGEYTGRQRVRLITRDFFGNTLDIQRIIIPEDTISDFEEAGYANDVTGKLFIDLVPNKASAAPKKAGGFGVQRDSNSKPYLEWVLVGAEPPILDGEKALEFEVVQAAMAERKNHLKELQKNGYQGSKTGESTSSTNRTSFGAKKAPAKAESLSGDDIPFDDVDF